MKKFYVGQRVVCIKSKYNTRYKFFQYEKGQEYTIEGIKKFCSHYPLILDLDKFIVPPNVDHSYCGFCSKEAKGLWADAKDFVPLEELEDYETTSNELIETLKNHI